MTEANVGLDVHTAFRDHGSSLLGFAVNALRDRGLAEDCLQETFVRAWRARDRYDPSQGSARTWLFAIARRVVVDALRARGRLPRALEEGEVDQVAAPEEDPVDRIALVAALAQLDEDKREAVVAVHLEGLSYAEYSARCGIGVPTLRTRVFYGLRALRAHLEELEGDDG